MVYAHMRKIILRKIISLNLFQNWKMLFKKSSNIKEYHFGRLKEHKIVHVSTYDTFCGIADYCKVLKTGIDNVVQLNKNNVIALDMDYIKSSTADKLAEYYSKIANQCQDYDTVILQHEFSFFISKEASIEIANNLFIQFLKELSSKQSIKNILVIMHTSPDLVQPFSLTSIFWNTFIEIPNIKKVKVLSTNSHMTKELAKYGIVSAPIIVPVDKIIEKYPSINPEIQENIKKELSLKEDDVVLSIVGFITPIKNHESVLEVLDNLPTNYKFLIIGGFPPQTPKKVQSEWQQSLDSKIKDLGLESRVYITGCYKNEDLKSYTEMVDIMLAPYSNNFKLTGASILTMIQTLKPTIAYATEALLRTNKHCKFKPLEFVEYNNKNALKDKILSMAKDTIRQEYLKNQAIGYTDEMTPEKLAKLVLINIED